MKNYLNTLIPFLLLTGMANNLQAQSHIKTAEQKALDENFRLTTPAETTDISKPFRISGYGVPGAKVEIRITPISQGGKAPKFVSVPHGKQNPYKVQNYTATIAGDGSWQLSANTTVKFNEGAKGRRIHVFAGQEKDGLVSKNPVNREIKLKDDPLFVATGGAIFKTNNIKLTSHVDGDQAHGPIQLKGIGKPGAVFLLSLNAYAYVTGKSVGLVGGKAHYEARFFKTHKVTVDKNGKWEIPVFQHFGNTDWVKKAFVVTGWTVRIGPLSPDDKAFPEESKHFIRLIVNEQYRHMHMRETESHRNN